MQVSDRGIVALAMHEGIVLGPYKDSVGVWTIGIGHTANAGPPDPAKAGTISLAEAIEIFRRDIGKFEARVLSAVKVPMDQHEFDALVSFDFNTGGIFRAQLTKHLNNNDGARAASAFMGWLKPPEIRGRREAEMVLFRSGMYPQGNVPLYKAANGRAIRDGFISAGDLLAMIRPAPAVVDQPLATSGVVVNEAPESDRQTGIWAAFLRFLKEMSK